MKKIVSLLLATAVILCLGITSFASDAAPFSFVENKTISVGTGTTDVTLDINIDVDTTQNFSMLALLLTFDSKNVKVKSIDSSKFPIPYSTGGSDINTGLFSFINDADPSATYEIANGTTVTIPVTFTVNDTVEAVYSIGFSSDNTMLLDAEGNPINDLETYPTATITVGSSAPAVKTITKKGTDVLINDAREKSEGITTAEQIGGAAGFAFTIPEGVKLDDNMIWSLTTSEGKKFSQKVNAGLSALSGDVKVAATFVTGSHLAGEGRTPFNFEIKAADGIFKAGEEFYFTDAADAALKAE